MFNVQNKLSKNLLALTVAFSMTIAGVGTFVGVGPASAGSRHTKNYGKSKAKVKSKKAIKQGGGQANKNNTAQTTGNGGDGGDNTLSCNSVLSGNQVSPTANVDLGPVTAVVGVLAFIVGAPAPADGGNAVVAVPIGPNGSANNSCASTGGSTGSNVNGTNQGNAQTNTNTGSNGGDTAASGTSGTAADTGTN